MRLELTLLLLTCNTLQRCRCACSNPPKHRITASPPRKRLDKRACRELALPQHLRSLALARTHYCYALLSHVACVWCPRFRCAALSSFCHVDMWGVSSFRWGDKLSLLEMQLQVCGRFCVYEPPRTGAHTYATCTHVEHKRARMRAHTNSLVIEFEGFYCCNHPSPPLNCCVLSQAADYGESLRH
jgi:hypothetical protein